MTNENGNIFRYLSEMSKENILCARAEFNKQGKPRPGKGQNILLSLSKQTQNCKISHTRINLQAFDYAGMYYH